MNLEHVIMEVQQALGVTIDGRPGVQTWTAIRDRIVPGAKSDPLPPSVAGRVDDRSEGVIATLHPAVHDVARALVHRAAGQGITVKLISGTRTYAEQNALYQKGRTAPGPRVTNATGGYSNHNFGIAFDVGIFSGNRYLEESPAYKAVGAIGVDLGLSWGGNWKSLVDEPHFQLVPKWGRELSERDLLKELRARREIGKDVFA